MLRACDSTDRCVTPAAAYPGAAAASDSAARAGSRLTCGVKQTSKVDGRPAATRSSRRVAIRSPISSAARLGVVVISAICAGCSKGSQPSATSATRRIAALLLPPIQIGGPGRCAGRGSMTWPDAGKYGSSRSTTSPVQAACIAAMAASNRPPRPSNCAPSTSNSGFWYPAPMPTISRPPESRSRLAVDFAVR